MAGTWESQNKVLPGAYINIRTNEPLSITPGDRGTGVILQEMSVGTDGAMYTITATEAAWPDGATASDKKLAAEALKKAKPYWYINSKQVTKRLTSLRPLQPLKPCSSIPSAIPMTERGEEVNTTAIATWIKAMRDDEGCEVSGGAREPCGRQRGIINVVQGIIMPGNQELTAAEVTAWVAGATAGASITTSNTGMVYAGAIDVKPRMTKSEMESAVTAGKFIFKVDTAQNVSVVYDINSLTAVTVDKGKMFTKNRVIRTVDNIANDITKIFEANYVGKSQQ